MDGNRKLVTADEREKNHEEKEERFKEGNREVFILDLEESGSWNRFYDLTASQIEIVPPVLSDSLSCPPICSLLNWLLQF